ncbi:pyridoxal phosphate-dependent decarboxylase family protein [Haliangium sp.]|uniref:pyridoxal phosphate-dependent decarboxylase family protein n=1 Tax=Haliangium sp. TaxID=2663208 RepID=UPI003D0AA10C
MSDIHHRLRAEVLDPDERNLSALVSKIERLHGEIAKHSPPGSTRIGEHTDIDYERDLDAVTVPSGPLPNHEALARVAHVFRGCVRWHDPRVMLNVSHAPLLNAIAASTMAALYNVNAMWDFYSGEVVLHERRISRFLTDRAGWDRRHAGGLSTFGGKATLMYAIKSGLNRCDRRAIERGVSAEHVVLTTSNNHYSLESVCNTLGLGKRACVRARCHHNEEVDLDHLEYLMRRSLSAGKRIACILLSGGSTLDHNIDPVDEVWRMRERLVAEYDLDYRPHIHVDTVNGWVWLLFRDYDFAANPLDLSPAVAAVCERAAARAAQIERADSFSADFHKTGLCPYISSFYFARDFAEVRSLHELDIDSSRPTEFGDEAVHGYSLENSRPAAGVASAWAMLSTLGVDGLRTYVTTLMSTGLHLRELVRTDYGHQFEILNDYNNWHATVIKPRFAACDLSFAELLDAPRARALHNDIAAGFFRRYALDQPGSAPLVGFIPRYKAEQTDKPVAAFLLYPMSLYHDHARSRALLAEFADAMRAFEGEYAASQRQRRMAVIPPK